MAGQSKRRRDDDDDGSDEVEIESANSSLRQQTNKRTKVALARASGSTVLSDDNEHGDDGYANGFLEEGDSFVNETNEEPDEDTEVEDAEVYEVTMTHLDSDSDGEGVDELMATQVVGKEMKRKRRNIVQEEGIVEEIFCKNFMCHTNLRIKLGPNINFIIGHNGSGKSAVLTALTMCLGAKASQTNRGASLKSLIKEGTDSATLGVRIKNQGENAYKSGEYGHSIIVERHFNRSGTSGFKLKNDNGKTTVSTKRADLDDILDYFGLQLDNPINVLTQDMARQFLSNSTPTDKYKFFLRGTMLENLDADYKCLEMNLDNIEVKLSMRKEDLVLLKQKFQEAVERRGRAKLTKTLEEKLNRVVRMFAWAQIREQEEKIKLMQGDVDRAQAEVDEKKGFAETVDARFEAAEAKVNAGTRAVQQHQTSLGPAEEKWTTAKAALDENTQALTNFKSEERMMKEYRRNAIKEISELEGKILTEERLLAGQGGEAHARRQSELQELKNSLAEAQEKLNEHAGRIADLEKAKREANDRLAALESDVREANTALQAAQGNLGQFEKAENKKYAPFAQNMETLCREIDRETRWRSKPVGPFGLHIELLKPEWSAVVESVLGGTLNAFAVTNKDDAEIFNKIAKRVRCNASVYINVAAPLDTTGKEPAEEIDTILRVLNIKSDIVRNSLIINQMIEQTALVADIDEANKLMYDRRPSNVKATLSLVEKHQTVAGHRLALSRSGAQKSDPVRHLPGLPRMQTDHSERLRAAKDRVNEATRESDVRKQHRNQAREVHKRSEQAILAHQREQRRLKTAVQEAHDAVEGKEAEIDNNKPQDGKLQELQSQLVAAQGEKKKQEESLGDLFEQKTVFDEKAPPLLEAANASKQEFHQVEQRIVGAERELSNAAEKRTEVLYQKNEAHSVVADAERTVKRLQDKVVEHQGVLAEWLPQAESVSPRVAIDEGETSNSLQRKMDTCKAQLEKERRRLGASEEELTREWKRTRDEWKEAQKQWDGLNKMARMLKGSLKERQHRWRRFRDYISARARFQFSWLLSERQFRGRVLLDHDDRKLDIKVEPDMAKASDSGREARTLSGGEKSFSTICLLLSIWEAMGSPIRCLDEFDVFMDSVNRAQSMSLMIQAARRSAGRQFILITPQAMNNVDVDHDVKIHKMSDPERGQTTLNFDGEEA